MQTFIFYALATLILLCSMMVVAGRNPVTSAIFLVLDLFFIAAVYATLEAHFAAVIQILVYAGAIVVLFLFVIMLLNMKSDELNSFKLTFPEAAVLGITIAGFFIIGILVMRDGPTGAGEGALSTEAIEAAGGNTLVVAMKMFTNYLWPFELASFLILLAIVASIMIARKEKAKT